MKTYGVNGKKNIIGEKVKKLRKAQRWSQNDLAIRVQLKGRMTDQRVISRIERGCRIVTDYELLTIALVFGVSADELLMASCAEGDTLTNGNGKQKPNVIKI